MNTVLIVAPLNTRRSWEATFDRQYPDMPVKRISSKNSEIINILDLQDGVRGVYLVGWEYMRAGNIFDQYADLVIADETHKQANGKSQQSLTIKGLRSKYRIALSGTPSGNNEIGIWSTLNWLWPDKYKSLWKWVDEYFLQRRNGSVIDIVREQTPGRMISEIPMFTRRLRRNHRSDMPAVLPEIQVEVDLTPAQRKIYKQFDELALAWLGDHPTATVYPLEQNIRLRQVALGVPKIEMNEKGYPVVTFDLNTKSSKIDMLVDIIKNQESEDTFLVLVHSAKFIPAVVHQLNKKGIKAEAFYGATPADTRERLLVELGSTYRVLVAGIAAIGEGTDGLQHKCHNMVWLSKHPDAKLNTQAAWRLDRPGQTESVNVWNIYAKDTKDEESLERLDEINGNLVALIDN